MNIFWVDTETTGLDPLKNSIVEMACAIETDGVTSSYLHFYAKPDESIEEIQEEALRINGFIKNDIMTFPRSYVVVSDIIRILDPMVKDKDSKFVIAGQNADFDRQFIRSMFGRNCRLNEFERLFSYRVLDTSSVFTMLRHNNIIDVTNSSLESICSYLGITYKAHSALHDLSAAMKAYRILSRRLTLMPEAC